VDKLFIFAYPHPVFFDNPPSSKWSSCEIDKLNEAIEIRYRDDGFRVGFVVYNNLPIDPRIDYRAEDLVISDGQDVTIHHNKGEIRRNSDNELAYTPAAYVAKKIPQNSILRIGGFHLNDCVEKISSAAYGLGHDVIVDEELTELYKILRPKDNFNPTTYPSVNRLRYFLDEASDPFLLKYFLKSRTLKPWLYNWREHPDTQKILSGAQLD